MAVVISSYYVQCYYVIAKCLIVGSQCLFSFDYIFVLDVVLGLVSTAQYSLLACTSLHYSGDFASFHFLHQYVETFLKVVMHFFLFVGSLILGF